MKRIQYHSYGGPEVMRFEDFEPAPLGASDVLVRMRAASANPMDWGIRAGRLRFLTGRTFPRALGYDFAGVVEAVGEGVTRVRAGDAVVGGARIKASGAFADVVVAKEDDVVRKPQELSFEQAATLPVVGVTALQGLVTRGKLRRGQAVFIHGCLGALGRCAVQIAHTRGATVAGSCRATATAEARELGVDPVVAFDFAPASLAGRFDLVLDAAGVPGTLPIGEARRMLRPGGRIVGVHPTPGNVLRSALPGPFHVFATQPSAADLETVVKIAADGGLRLPIARSVPLSQAIPALTDLERKRIGKRGKLVITAG